MQENVGTIIEHRAIMIYKVRIPLELPALNEIINAAKTPYRGKGHKRLYAYTDMKETYTSAACYAIRAASIPPLESVVGLFQWYVKDRRKDSDNVSAGQKFVFDGLVEAGVLKNDGFNQVRGFLHAFEIDKQHPRLELTIYPCKATTGLKGIKQLLLSGG